MKKFKLAFLSLLFPLAAFASTEVAYPEDIVINIPVPAETDPAKTPEYKPFDVEFYQNFITAAWLEQNGKNAEAFKYYEQLNTIVPKNPAIIKSLVNLAIAAENTEAMDKYIPTLIEISPNDPNTLSVNATWLWSQGKLQEALALYEKAIKQDPENPEIVFKYVTLLSNIDSDRAVAYLHGLSKDLPRMSGLISLQIAELYLKSNDNKGAVKYLEQAIGKNPDLPEPYLGLAKIYEADGNNSAALQQYLDMEQAGLADSVILTKIGAYYVLANKKDLSVKYFLKAKALDNGNPSAAQFLALDAQSRADYEAAVKYIKESRDFEKTPSYWIRVSYFLNRLDKVQEAGDNLKQAHLKFEGNNEIAFYYALSLIDLQNYKEADKVLKEILASTPDNEMVLFHYSFVLERQDKYKDMRKVLGRILELNPKNADALNFLGYHLVDKTKELERGGEYIKQAVALKADEPAFIDSLAWYFYKKGDLDQSLNLLKGIEGSMQSDPEIILHTATVYYDMSNYDKAAQYYELLLKRQPEDKAAKKGLKRALKKLAK